MSEQYKIPTRFRNPTQNPYTNQQSNNFLGNAWGNLKNYVTNNKNSYTNYMDNLQNDNSVLGAFNQATGAYALSPITNPQAFALADLYPSSTANTVDTVNPILTPGGVFDLDSNPLFNNNSVSSYNNNNGYRTPGMSTAGTTIPADTPKNTSMFNAGNFQALSSVLGGVGSLAQGWGALKTASLAKQQMNENKRQYEQNYAAQKTLTNNALENQNAWKLAQGRNDLAKLVL